MAKEYRGTLTEVQTQLAKDFNVDKTTLSRWVKKIPVLEIEIQGQRGEKKALMRKATTSRKELIQTIKEKAKYVKQQWTICWMHAGCGNSNGGPRNLLVARLANALNVQAGSHFPTIH